MFFNSSTLNATVTFQTARDYSTVHKMIGNNLSENKYYDDKLLHRDRRIELG